VTANELDDLPPPGAVLAGKYAVVRLIGRGGMGVVLEAQHLRLGQRVALKLLKSTYRAMPEIMARFEREARAIARLTGPHVARILDVEALPDGSPFMVMELLRGRELDEEREARGKIPPREAVGYILQACAGMAEAHRMGIVHRDLKPSNLFLCDQDGYRTVKVLDFGISKLTGDVHAAMTTTASAFGTPLYMSPEQVRSVKHVDARADIWSLGVVLYELLSGETPFNHPSATAILASIIADKPVPIQKRCPDISRGLADVVMRALEKDPDARYADVREFAAALAPYGPPRDDPGQAAVAVELLGVEGPSMTARKRRVLALAAAAVIAIAAAVFFMTSSPDTAPVAAPDPATAQSAQPTLTTVSPTSAPPTVEPAPPPSASVETAPSAPTPLAPSQQPAPRRKPSAEPAPSAAPQPKPTSTNDPNFL
jgi:serine/threonine-protein kinase